MDAGKRRMIQADGLLEYIQTPLTLDEIGGMRNLKKWLLSNGQTGLSTHVVVNLGLQMLKALQHLHKRKMLHKDVATRNCLCVTI